METVWKDYADELLGKLRQKRTNAWISNETIHLADDKREVRNRGDVLEYKILRNEIQRLIYVKTRTRGCKTNAINLISTIAQVKHGSFPKKSEK